METILLRSIALMHDRSNGLGGGLAAYGIYPRHANQYAFHMMFENMEAKQQCEEYFKDMFNIVLDEEISTRPGAVFEQNTSGRYGECRTQPITSPPLFWRYFMDVPELRTKFISEREYVVEKVMEINSKLDGTFIASSGKNM